MAINSLADYEASARDRIYFRATNQNVGRNAAADWRSWSRAVATGVPTAIPAPANTANGTVPAAGDTGIPKLPTWANAGYVSHIEVCPTGQTGSGYQRWLLYDRLFQCGAYNVNNASQTLTSQPSYSGRIPNSDYSGTQLWVEYGSSASGTPTLTVTYTDQAGGTGHSTSVTLSSGAYSAQRVPLASGDSGVQKIESVTTTASGSGTFSVLVVRPLAMLVMPGGAAPIPHIRPLEHLGPRRIYSTSALAWLASLGATTITIPEGDLVIEVAGN